MTNQPDGIRLTQAWEKPIRSGSAILRIEKWEHQEHGPHFVRMDGTWVIYRLYNPGEALNAREPKLVANLTDEEMAIIATAYECE